MDFAGTEPLEVPSGSVDA